jgi:hypothetical protein
VKTPVWATLAIVWLAGAPGVTLAQDADQVAAPIPADATIFAADFDSAEPLNPPDEWPKWRYEDGAFVVQYPEGRSPFAFLVFRDDIGRLPARVRVTVSVTLLDGRNDQQFGIEFGHDLVEGSSEDQRGSGHPYQFGLTGNQEFVIYVPTPRWLNRQTHPDIKPRGETNLITIEVDGTLVRCYVNGHLVVAQMSPVPVTGYLGFYVGAGVEVAFDDLQIEELSSESE